MKANALVAEGSGSGSGRGRSFVPGVHGRTAGSQGIQIEDS